jgi:hypothetical protein
MRQTWKLVLLGLVVAFMVIAIGRMLRSTTPSPEEGQTEALVSKLIANDPLIAPVTR